MATSIWEELGMTAAKAAIATLAGGLMAAAMKVDWSFSSLFGSDDDKPKEPNVVPAGAATANGLMGGFDDDAHVSASDALDEAYSRGFDGDADELRSVLREVSDLDNVTVKFENQGTDLMAVVYVDGSLHETVMMEN